MIRFVHTNIVNPTGGPREGLPVWFYPNDGGDPVIAVTDASGDLRVELDTEKMYRVPVENAVTVDSLSFPAGIVFVVQVPEGEGFATAMECLVGTEDASRTTLLDLIAEQKQMILDLTSRIEVLEQGAE